MRKALGLGILIVLMALSMGCPPVERIPEIDPPEVVYYPQPKEWTMEWSRTFGGEGWDRAYSVYQTACGGFVIAGHTNSFGAGRNDFWLVKTDPQGNKEWSRTFGTPSDERATSVRQTADGGFIIVGDDFWVVRTDPQGNKEWSRFFGKEEFWTRAHSVYATACGGFIIAGNVDYTIARYADLIMDKRPDMWVVKVDADGNKVWGRTFGGPESEGASSVQQTACGGFIIAGGAGIPMRTGSMWLVKTDAQGNKEWTRTFRHVRPSFRACVFDMAMSVQQTRCGDFIIAGITAYHAEVDFWLLRTDGYGNKRWSRIFGNGGCEVANCVQQTRCGGFIVVGTTSSFVGEGPSGQTDIWLIATDPEGNKRWSKTLGGREWERGRAVKQTACGGLIVAGSTESFGAGRDDFWLIKLAPEE